VVLGFPLLTHSLGSDKERRGINMQCNCGGAMYERQEDLKPYLKCDVCGRVYAPNHPGRPESKDAPQQSLDNCIQIKGDTP